MLTSHLITQHWPLDNISFGASFQTYPTRRVVQIHSRQGDFVAKIDQQPPTYAAACQPYAVVDFLAAQGFPYMPALLKTRAGQPLFYGAGQSVALMEYIDGGPPANRPATWQALGQIAAQLNSFTGCPITYAIPTSAVIVELTAQAQNHPQPQQFCDFIDQLSPLLDAPTAGVVHGEINLANVVQRRDGTLVVLDWDAAGTGSTVLEAGYPLLVVFLTEALHFQQEQAVAFYRGYYGAQLPSAAEQDLLFRAALLHALRYMHFANQPQRWARICYAVAHRDHLLAAIFD